MLGFGWSGPSFAVWTLIATTEPGQPYTTSRSSLYSSSRMSLAGPWLLEEDGKLEEAIAEFRLTLKSSPDNITALTALGHAQGAAGKRAEAEKVIRRLHELSKQQYVSPFQTAVGYAGLDDRRLALDWLEKSRQERFNWLPFIQVDPVFKNLRSENRVAELAKNLGLSK